MLGPPPSSGCGSRNASPRAPDRRDQSPFPARVAHRAANPPPTNDPSGVSHPECSHHGSRLPTPRNCVPRPLERQRLGTLGRGRSPCPQPGPRVPVSIYRWTALRTTPFGFLPSIMRIRIVRTQLTIGWVHIGRMEPRPGRRHMENPCLVWRALAIGCLMVAGGPGGPIALASPDFTSTPSTPRLVDTGIRGRRNVA